MELFGYLEGRPGLVRWRQGRCLPYGEGIALWALGEIVKAEAGILEADSPAQAGATLDGTLPRGDPGVCALWAGLSRVGGGGWGASRTGGVVHGLAAGVGVVGSGAGDGAGVRGSALGGRGAARFPRVSGGLVGGRAVTGVMHGPARAPGATSDLGRGVAK